eukprot:CAMPEP_0173144406 /NCGR_PEP_ID=MMETSP1105-20130129/7212_1 /TAXON_ID=2985 /ORGANISM="Ochromonas sp., Strain BG-1" /LENGTH=39 /DNA_ID= /DNA_START= /DNA_END= /DNA_ORIENTATION=
MTDGRSKINKFDMSFFIDCNIFRTKMTIDVSFGVNMLKG